MRSFTAALLLVLAAGVFTAGLVHAQYVSDDIDLYVGQPVRLANITPGDTLLVTYRPNSSIAHREQLVLTPGTRDWTPREAGVVRLAVSGGAAQNVSVRYDETPVAGLFVLIVAGLILFGGAAFAFRKLFGADGPPDTAPAVRPDT